MVLKIRMRNLGESSGGDDKKSYLGQPTETPEPTVVSENVDNVLTEFNFDDEFFSQGKLNNPQVSKASGPA